MKKGFTLIELLAVILILGIIALIAIPTVNNILKEARYGAFKSGNEAIMKTVEQNCQTSLIKGENPVLSYLFEEGKSSQKIDVKGTLPSDGYILLDKDCNITDYYLSDNKNTHSNGEDVRGDYMLKASIEEEISLFKTLYPDYFNNIISIDFINNLNIPNNAIEIKDPSVSENEKIKSWLIEESGNYKLYVGSEKNIYANFNSSYLFNDLKQVSNINLNNFHTFFVKNSKGMFKSNNSLTKLDTSKFYTSNIVTMKEMFRDCYLLENIDVSNFDMKKVQTIQAMFCGCVGLKVLDVSNWDTSNIHNFTTVFSSCRQLKTIDVSNWVTSNVIDAPYMFSECSSLEYLDLSKWNTNLFQHIQYMFSGCNQLKTLLISQFNTNLVKDMSNLFAGCRNLKKLDLSNWEFNNVENFEKIFYLNNQLESLILKDINSLNKLKEYIPDRSSNTIGILSIVGDKTSLDSSILSSKNWNVL